MTNICSASYELDPSTAKADASAKASVACRGDACSGAAASLKLFLDGLRGWASLYVCFSHFIGVFWSSSTLSYDGDRTMYNVPLVLNGSLFVYVFFVLPGFALSTGYVSKRRNVANSLLRPAGLARLAVQRYLRLAVPIFAVAVVTAILVSAGAMRNVEAGYAITSTWLGCFYRFVPSAKQVVRFSFGDALFGNADFPTSLISQAWTMPLEFSGSFIVFVLCWIFEDAKQRILIYGFAAVLLKAYASQLVGFVYGMAIAESYDYSSFQQFRVSA